MQLWSKKLSISSGNTINATPFLLPGEINFNELKNYDGRYYRLFQTKEMHQVSQSQNVSIQVAGNTITATWIGEASVPHFFCTDETCTHEQNVFSHKVEPIRYATFYPGREDLIILAVGNAVYVIEIDKRGTQNFQPLYTGSAPDFRFDEDGGELVIRDGGKFLTLTP